MHERASEWFVGGSTSVLIREVGSLAGRWVHVCGQGATVLARRMQGAKIVFRDHTWKLFLEVRVALALDHPLVGCFAVLGLDLVNDFGP